MPFGINFTEEQNQEDLAHFLVHERVVKKWEEEEERTREEKDRIKKLVDFEIKKLNNKK